MPSENIKCANIQMKSEQWERLRTLYKSNLWRFCHDVLDYADIDNSFHREELAKVDEYRAKGNVYQQAFFWPRLHLKTSCLTVALDLQDIVNNPNIRILLLSSTEKLVVKALSHITDIIMNGDKFNFFFPEIRPLDANAMRKNRFSFEVNRSRPMMDATIEASSIDGNITGSHFDVIDYDDVINWENTQTPEKIDSIKTKIDYSLSILDSPGFQRWKGTKYSGSDYYSLIENDPDYIVSLRQLREPDGEGEEYKYGDKNDHDKYIFPQKFNSEMERKLRKEGTGQSEFVFFSQYFNRIISREERLFKEDMIKYYTSYPPGGFFFITCDPAGSITSYADKTAIMVCYWAPRTEEHPNGAIYVIKYINARMPNDMLAEYLFGWYAEIRPQMMSLEISGGIGTGLWDYMMSEAKKRGFEPSAINFQPYRPSTKESKYQRISLLPAYMKRGDLLMREEHQELRNQLLAYTGIRKKEKDDLADVLAQQLKIGQFPDFSIGDYDEEETEEYEPLFDSTGY